MVAGFQVRLLQTCGRFCFCATVSAGQVIEAMKILRGDDTRATGRVTYLTREPNATGLVFISGAVGDPNPKFVL